MKLVTAMFISKPSASPAHTDMRVRNHFVISKVCALPQPLYSPDPSPCDFYLFPKLRIVRKGQEGDMEKGKYIILL